MQSLSIPIWMLLGFAVWTHLLLSFTVGVYRWGHVFFGTAGVGDFKADDVQGADWYRRSMRAHANCVENLPVFGAVVFALHAANAGGPLVDGVAITVLVARLCQSVVHVSVEQSNRVVAVRFTFFLTQLVGYFTLVGILVAGVP